jgi:hypothetical protein
MVREDCNRLASLKELFEGGAAWLGAGLRGAELATRFREAFDAHAEDYLSELQNLTQIALRQAGLANWPGARLGSDLMDLASLSDPEAAERIVLALVASETLQLKPVETAETRETVAGLGWLGGALFRGGRLLGYLKAAEEDPEKALAYLRRNLAREIQRKRDAADPVGAALFSNLKTAAAGAAESEGASDAKARTPAGAVSSESTGSAVIDSTVIGSAMIDSDASAHASLIWQPLVLARAGTPGRRDETSETSHAEALRLHAALAPLQAAAERNAARPEGTRNLVMRGPAFAAPLHAHFVSWGASKPADPPCDAVHIGELSNVLRGDLPAQAELCEVAMPTDAEGRELAIAVAPTWLRDGPSALETLFANWSAALDAAPKLSPARLTKLHAILELVAERLHAGQFQDDALAGIRTELAIKPQTFSDDWKLLRNLCPLGPAASSGLFGAGEAKNLGVLR